MLITGYISKLTEITLRIDLPNVQHDVKVLTKQLIKGKTITLIKAPCLEDMFNSSNMYNIKILSTNQGKDILYTEINLPSNYLRNLLVSYFASKNTLFLNQILLHFRLYKEKGMWTFLLKSISERARTLPSTTDKKKYFGEIKWNFVTPTFLSV